MIVQIDTREKEKAIEKIQKTFEEKGIKTVSSKMYVGDYQNLQNGSVVVDRKQNLSEICSNVCQQHERFKAELIRAQEAGIKIFILCEHGKDIKTIEDVKNWVNPRLKKSPKALTGEKLYKIMKTQEAKYGITYLFCDKEETGEKILEILGKNS
jgi:ERCC4-type nuclease